MKKTTAVVAAVAFLACIVAANYVTTRYGMVHVAPGLTATAGTYLAGITFVLRDVIHDIAGKYATAGLIVAGAGLSYLLSDPYIALASGVAFLVSETADQLVYSPLREKRGYIAAALASNTIGAAVDTILFLWIAGFPVWSNLTGQMVGKLTVTAAVVLAVRALGPRLVRAA